MTARHAADPTDPAAPRAVDELRPWFTWAGTLLVAFPSFWALAYFQHRLFQAAFPFAPPELTAALAVGIDSFGVLAGAYWLRSPRGTELRRWGFVFAILAVLGSTLLMVWSIARLAPGYELLGAIPALIVFGTTKLLTVWQADRAATRATERDHAAELAAAEQRVADADGRAAELAGRVAELEQRLAAAATPARRLAVVPESPEVAAQGDADTGPLPIVDDAPTDPDNPEHVAQVADWIRAQRAVDAPDGQRYAAEAFRVSRPRIAAVVRAAKDLVDAETPAEAVGT